jgi:hypothetical protein
MRGTAPDRSVGAMDPLAEAARAVLDAHWRPPGFTVPNATVYPWQWLWDSCFHAVALAGLGAPDRGVTELATLLGAADPSGFVPHVVHHGDPGALAAFWGRTGSSCLTQPPLHGWALAELAATGVRVPDALVDAAVRALRWLAAHRRRAAHDGLLVVVHPWETGGDDSPRWDPWCPGRWSPSRWYAAKGALVHSTVRDAAGAAVANPRFEVAAASFNALTAWSARALAPLGAADDLRALADELTEALQSRWDPVAITWSDGGGSRARTLDAMVTTLVDPRPVAFGALVDPAAYGAPAGPCGVHRAEPSFAPDVYWRGSAWPQLTYLLWRAASATGATADATTLARGLRHGATASGLAEHWNPDTGAALGAVPQSWTALAALVPV